MFSRNLFHVCEFCLLNLEYYFADLLVYLQSSIPNLVNKIHKRGRDYEKTISIEYLSRLNERYEAWITNYNSGKLLKINVDDLDFVENKADYETILELIKKEL